LKPGDWLTNRDSHDYQGSEGPFEYGREFYEFVEYDHHSSGIVRIKAFPIYLDAPVDRTKKPHNLYSEQWRLCSPEEIAQFIRKRMMRNRDDEWIMDDNIP
jgi:hypothetical protein